MVDDLAGQKEVVRGDLLSPIFFRGKHVVCICIVFGAAVSSINSNLHNNANTLFFFRARNGKDVEALDKENSALAYKPTLLKLYDYAAREKFNLCT